MLKKKTHLISDYKCGRSKTTAILHELSAQAMDDLSQRMQKQPFSLATDGGNDRGKLKQFPLVVTIEGETGLVNPELLALQPCEGKASGKYIL